MPNQRRRKFSVQSDLGNRNKKNRQQVGTSSATENDFKIGTSENVIVKPSTVVSNTKLNQAETQQSVQKKRNPKEKPTPTTKIDEVLIKEKKETSDKDVTARSSNIDLVLNTNDYPSDTNSEQTNDESTNYHANLRDNSSRRQDHYIHRTKVRSPKRRVALSETQVTTTDLDKCEISTSSSIIQDVQIEHSADTAAPEAPPTAAIQDQLSSYSIGDMCRICHGGESLSSEWGGLVSACSCRGSVGRVHVRCLERWLTESGKSRCELCGARYATQRVHRYGVPKALFMWIMSQNTKQLMVDSLGIMLMSPLAVLAAWLSGRTLAGLMAQDPQTAPWPLASTFVLACMTLVCYYCWVVSAATRHALGWWLWYRSQYEVRLELNH